MLLMLILVGVLNVAISWWNCRAVGLIWDEARFVGGPMRMLAWAGAIEATLGFSSVLLMLVTLYFYATGQLPQEYLDAVGSLWYLLIIIPAIGSGVVITLHSLENAWRERNFGNIAVAAWNVFATAQRLERATHAMPAAFEKVSKLFQGKDDRKAALVVMIVLIAVTGGALITWKLIRHYAQQARGPQLPEDTSAAPGLEQGYQMPEPQRQVPAGGAGRSSI
ncbi:hypothetical protein P0Y43_23265 [Pseudomonas entomophila]|uniref:hypothetical protein n=1 Tax=Pseudomonas entomophila TaxID=312306 RepID=UPI0023D8546F|nr:hypothetical protein [Pseudomonas entomophila]MDF0733612.1 hypothetical protein [Pseudomonas entomophila]